MRLHEHQSKTRLAQYGIPIPHGSVAGTPQEAYDVARHIGKPVMVKSQVLFSGRQNQGGLLYAATPEEAAAAADQLLGRELKGYVVRTVLVDEAIEIEREIYLAVTIDRVERSPVLITSLQAQESGHIPATSEIRFRLPINPLLGLQDYQARQMGFDLGLRNHQVPFFTRIARGLYQAYIESDATLAELNPLAITDNGDLVAINTQLHLDDDALFRHPDLQGLHDPEQEIAVEREARKEGMRFVHLQGNIGCIVNGAGLAMTTMDLIRHYGGQPANFLDIGGGAQANQVARAFQLILQNLNVKVILLNIFGGITRCDEVAVGILSVVRALQTDIPLVVRLRGVHADEGQFLLNTAGIPCVGSMSQAAQKAVALAEQATQSQNGTTKTEKLHTF